MKHSHVNRILIPAFALFTLIAVLGVTGAQAQLDNRWMAAGSFHNWFSNMGCEIEVGRNSSADQQDGGQWPAWYNYQDCQAAKGLWIATSNYTDASNIHWAHKVEHVGPRVQGNNEFFPVKFEMVSKYAPPDVQVDGVVSEGKAVQNDRVDPTMLPDRVFNNVVNTAIGVTMTRTVMQFSQQYHDNYMIYDYVFTNTGNVNGNSTIELPNQTLDSVYFYFQYRDSPVADVRYVIGNPTSWGLNAMNDVRGDGFILPTTGRQDTDDSVNVPGYSYPHMRAQFVWHGKFPPFTTYDNIGAPIWIPYYDKTDTTGRLGAPHFIGHVTVHADKSATDPSDDPAQPTTTSWEGSDEPNTSGNTDQISTKMDSEWGWITVGHGSVTRPGLGPRHAWAAQADGKFNVPTGDPALGTPGGFSNCDGYGPYRLGPGQSVHIVIAEGIAGLSREACIRIGRWYKANYAAAPAANSQIKNDSVMTGKDSLFLTFRRAIANFYSGYHIPAAPTPPKQFYVTSGQPISLTWDVDDPNDPNMKGFKIYRAPGRSDGNYELIHTAGPADRSFDDATATRGVAYYYYIQTIGDPALNTGAGLTPGDTLYSNRIYTQTFLAAYMKAKRPPGGTMDDIRIVPNPFILSSDPVNLRFYGEPDKIAFFNIPGHCKIRIYTELGELVNTIDHTDGSGDAYWKSITSSNQIVVSGIYIVVFEDMDTGQTAIRKLSIVR